MTKAAIGRWLTLLIATAATLGCSGGDAINIGNSQGSQISDYVGSWDGYAEAYTFQPDGSDRVRLTISANGVGTVEVGNQPLLAPPTDANVGYPPGGATAGGYVPNPPLWEGFLYPTYNPQIQTSRIQFGLKPNDFYAAWCALQTSYYIFSGTTCSGPPNDGGCFPTYMYNCLPGLAGSFSGTGTNQQCAVEIVASDGGTSEQPVDCGKFALCSQGVCACTAGSCAASPTVAAGALPANYPVEFDAALDSTGKTLTGTLALASSASYGGSSALRLTVVLTKQ